MKQNIIIAAVCTAFAMPVFAEGDHDHHHGKKTAGPNGGRVLTGIEPHIEFFVMPDRKIKLTVLDKENKPAAVTTQTASATGGDRAKPTKFTFAKEGDVLISDAALPEGNNNPPIILQLKAAPDGKTITERFSVNLADCSSCKHNEYACTCDHAGESHEGHDHKPGEKHAH